MVTKNTATTKKTGLLDFPVSDIVLGAENDLLYDRFGIANADDRELTISIRDNGIQEPLVVSADSVLLSGHRRFAAAKYLGLKAVPVRVAQDVSFNALSTPSAWKCCADSINSVRSHPASAYGRSYSTLNPHKPTET